MNNNKLAREPLFHISKRDTIPAWKSVLIRAIAICLAIFVGLLFASLYSGKNIVLLVEYLIDGVFGTSLKLWLTIREVAILLLISLAVAPAFKMKFWNIGADGQTLVGCLTSAALVYYLGGEISDFPLIVIMLISSIIAGAVWAVIPAIFKAKWNTNETLFTLMMNYVAIQLVAFTIKEWFPSGQNQYSLFYGMKYANLPSIGNPYVLTILLAIIATVLMYLYMKYTKHGYEISVVGESQNTAKYVGLSVPKVIIRTLILSGAICGFVGFLLVSGVRHSISTEIVGGMGFTAIIVCWLAKFNPVYMSLTSFLVIFLEKGTSNLLLKTGIKNSALADIITGLVFLFIIGCEFFIQFVIKRVQKEENKGGKN